MNKCLKKILSFVLTLTLVLSIVATSMISADAFSIPRNETSYGNLKYKYSNVYGGLEITDCNASASGTVTIPDSINGIRVTSIDYIAFYDCDNITKVVLPSTLTHIGEGAFYGCDKLASVNIPVGVTEIERNAFGATAIYDNYSNWKNNVLTIDNCLIEGMKDYNDYGIMSESYTVPNGIRLIADQCFSKQLYITSISVPSSVKYIGNFAFFACLSLNSVSLPDTLEKIGTDIMMGTIVEENNTDSNGILYVGKYLISSSKEYYDDYSVSTVYGPLTIKSGTIGVADLALSNSFITTLVIPESVKFVGFMAFWTCEKLESVTINAKNMKLGDGVFSSCYKLSNVRINGELSNIGRSSFFDTPYSLNEKNYKNDLFIVKNIVADGMSEYDDEGDFNYYPNRNLVIPDGVVGIGTAALINTPYVSDIVMPKSVKYINNNNFWNIKYPCKVMFFNDNIVIADDVFAESDMTFVCNKNSSAEAFAKKRGFNIEYLNNYQDKYFFTYKDVAGGVEITYGVTYTSGDLVLPSTVNGKKVVSLDRNALSVCDKITSVTIPASVENIADHCFGGCPVTKVNFAPDSKLKRLGHFAFADCRNLKSISLPSSVKTIGELVFAESGITTINLPDNIEEIGFGLFADTPYYNNSANWQNGVLYCGKYLLKANETVSGNYNVKAGTVNIIASAFSDCSVNNINIPSSVKYINAHALTGSIKNFTVDSSSQYFSADSNGILFSKDKKVLVKYPTAKVDTTYTVPESVVTIADSAFGYNNKIKQIKMSNNVKFIGSWAFDCCESLNRVDFSKNITEIGLLAFSRCPSLMNITLPDNIKYIGRDILDESGYAENRANWTGNLLYVGPYLVGADYESDSKTITVKSGTKVLSDDVLSFVDNLETVNLPDSLISIGEFALGHEDGEVKNINYAGSKSQWNNINFYDDITKNFNVKFAKQDTYILGDVNSDSNINSTDALMVLQATVGQITLNNTQKLAADVNIDTKVNSNDALKILQYTVGMISKF